MRFYLSSISVLRRYLRFWTTLFTLQSSTKSSKQNKAKQKKCAAEKRMDSLLPLGPNVIVHNSFPVSYDGKSNSWRDFPLLYWLFRRYAHYMFARDIGRELVSTSCLSNVPMRKRVRRDATPNPRHKILVTFSEVLGTF